jgi:hypothetical protein
LVVKERAIKENQQEYKKYRARYENKQACL